MLVNILSLFSLYCHYIFRPNRPSSGVQVVVMEESAAHCNALQLLLCSCLILIPGTGCCCVCVCLMVLLVCWFLSNLEFGGWLS
jgi:hypothetical protein